jgi:hypothetical protein
MATSDAQDQVSRVLSAGFLAAVSLAAAAGFLVYGGRLFLMLQRFPIESRGRKKKLREVGLVTAICAACFTIRRAPRGRCVGAGGRARGGACVFGCVRVSVCVYVVCVRVRGYVCVRVCCPRAWKRAGRREAGRGRRTHPRAPPHPQLNSCPPRAPRPSPIPPRAVLVALSAVDARDLDLDVATHPLLNLLYYGLAEILPSAWVLAILRKLPPKRNAQGYQTIPAQA